MEIKRSKRTIFEQKEQILNFICKNNYLVSNKCNTKEMDEKWDDLVKVLNTTPNGAKKDKKMWKHFLSEWKSKVRKKVREQNKIFQTSCIPSVLSSIDRKLLDVTNSFSPVTSVGQTAETDDVKDVEMDCFEVISSEEDPLERKPKPKIINKVFTTLRTKSPSQLQVTPEAALATDYSLLNNKDLPASINKMASAISELAGSFSELGGGLHALANALTAMKNK